MRIENAGVQLQRAPELLLGSCPVPVIDVLNLSQHHVPFSKLLVHFDSFQRRRTRWGFGFTEGFCSPDASFQPRLRKPSIGSTIIRRELNRALEVFDSLTQILLVELAEMITPEQIGFMSLRID